MQPHDRVNFSGLCFACSVFLSHTSRGFSLSSVVPFIAHRGRRIHPFASPHVRESGLRDPGSFLGNFCLWNPES